MIHVGDSMSVLRTLPSESVQCCVTSPPYYGLRDYGMAEQIGQERTPAEYVARLVDVFREVRRVLRADGTLWLNLGDSYANDGKWGGETGGKQAYLDDSNRKRVGREKRVTGLKPKDLIGIPWMVAFALRDDGWTLRQEIIWHKRAPMPESVRDRPTRAHEQVFLLSKSASYFYDAEAIAEPIAWGDHPRNGVPTHITQAPGQPVQSGITKRRRSGNRARVLADGAAGSRPADHLGSGVPWEDTTGTRNARSVWTLGPEPFPEAHFAVFPTEIPKRAILAGTSERGCCEKCGAPWERTVESESASADAPRDYQGVPEHQANRGIPQEPKKLGAVGTPARHTTGWHPGCDCAAATVPCVVLDPFCGAGTTGLVADAHQRHFIGIDLNPEYAEMARRRIERDGAPLFRAEGA